MEVADFLRRRPFTVLFSGGKDSLAALLWVIDNVGLDHDWNILYVEVTGNTHRLCNEYVHRICEELGVSDRLIHARREDADFFDYVRRYGLPLIGKHRWCLWQFKVKVFKKHSHFTQVSGVKRSDSRRRRNVRLVEYFRQSGNVAANPLLDWSDEMVVDFIREHGVEVNPCYRIYGHSGNCMPGSTLVLLSDYTAKPIGEIKVGDRVLAYDPENDRVEEGVVTHKFARPYEGKVVRIKTYGLYDLVLTPEHPVYVFIKRRFSSRPYYRWVWHGWMTARDLYEFYKRERGRGTWLMRPYVAYPFLTSRVPSPLPPEMLYFIGLYVAEGNIREGREVRFSLGLHEEELARKVAEIYNRYTKREARIKPRPAERELLVKCYSKRLANEIRRLVAGRRALEKKMSPLLLRLDPESQLHLLRGILDGDGCLSQARGSKVLVFVTASPHLAFQVHLLMLRQGMMAQLTTQRGSPFKPDRTYFRVQHYISGRHYGAIVGSTAVYSIQSITIEDYEGVVYNLEVRPHNNFITQGGLVHNCMLCPYHSKAKIHRTLQDPEWGPKIVEALRAVRAPRSKRMREIRDLWLRAAGQLPLTDFMG